jgi:retron-type reverse transcriptase
MAPSGRFLYVGSSFRKNRASSARWESAVRDRVGQEVLRQLLHPIFEPLSHEASFGFRPKRNCHRVLELHEQGYRVILDADIKGLQQRQLHHIFRPN